VNNGLTNPYVQCLAISGANLFAGTDSGGVFLTTDNGNSWTQVNGGLTYPTVYSFAVSGTNIFAGTQGGGVYLTTNSGTIWSQVSAGLGGDVVFSLASNGTHLFAGTLGRGVWVRPLSEMITPVPEEVELIPNSLALSQNYPNPFNPTTTISYHLPSQNHITLRVYNVLGREVATLVNDVKAPGTYSVQWDARAVSSGTYYFRITAGKSAEMKKVLLLK
jgi:hypothetical protein